MGLGAQPPEFRPTSVVVIYKCLSCRGRGRITLTARSCAADPRAFSQLLSPLLLALRLFPTDGVAASNGRLDRSCGSHGTNGKTDKRTDRKESRQNSRQIPEYARDRGGEDIIWRPFDSGGWEPTPHGPHVTPSCVSPRVDSDAKYAGFFAIPRRVLHVCSEASRRRVYAGQRSLSHASGHPAKHASCAQNC